MEDKDKNEDKPGKTLLHLEKDADGMVTLTIDDDAVEVSSALYRGLAEDNETLLRVVVSALAMYMALFDIKTIKSMLNDIKKMITAIRIKQ